MSVGLISADGKSIMCSRCHQTSHNQNDVVEGFCGHCHIWHGTTVELPPEAEDQRGAHGC